MFYVYILVCTSKKGKQSHYTGFTENLRRRFKEHEAGKKGSYTKRMKQLTLAHYEEYFDKKAALRREKEIKKLSFAQKKELVLVWS